MGRLLFSAGAVALSVWVFLGSSAATEQAVRLPAPTLDAPLSALAAQSAQPAKWIASSAVHDPTPPATSGRPSII